MKRFTAFLALLFMPIGAAQAQTADNAEQLVARWSARDTTCRDPTASAIDAVGACEQRDTLAKVLALAGLCHAPAAAADRSRNAVWTRCAGGAQSCAGRKTLKPARDEQPGGRFGEKVRMPLIAPASGLLSGLLGRRSAVMDASQLLDGAAAMPDELISALEARAIWARFGF